jgi:hypothetical protein
MVGSVAALALGCASQSLHDGDDTSTHAAQPLPECLSVDTTPCDTREVACQDRLLDLAACMYGVDTKPDVPITVVSEDQLIDELQGSTVGAPTTDPRTVHFEQALAELGLVQPGDLTEGGGSVEDLVNRIDGIYQGPKDGIRLVDRGMPRSDAESDALLLHELVHAVQDAEYDFSTWEADVPPDFDAILARRTVTEGEATMYQYRVEAAMIGHDVSKIDWDELFKEVRDGFEEQALKDAAPYLVAPASFPYGYGTLAAFRAWDADGPLYHRAQFGNPPRRSLDVMNAAYDEPAVTGAAPRIIEPPLPAPYISVDHGVMGAFLLELFAQRAGASADQARTLGLAWRADMIFICRNGDETGYLWELAFDTAEAVNDFQSLLTLSDGVTLEAEGKRLFLAGSGTPPDFMLETGRKFLSAAE